MTMMRTGLAGLAAAVLALPLAAPREAHAQDFTPDLYTCATLYDVLDTNKRSQQAINSSLSGPGLDDLDGHQGSLWRDAGAFWAFSNARHIDFGERRDALQERSGDSYVVFDLRVRGMSGTSRFPSPTSEAAGFPQGPVTSATQPPPTSETPPYGQWIRTCDQTHGFTPVFSFGADAFTRSAAISDFDCAVAHRLLAAIRHDIDQDQVQARSAMERAQHALRLHHTANPELDPGSLGPQVNGLARTRGEQIQQGRESGEALFNDINACEAKYGFAQAGGQ